MAARGALRIAGKGDFGRQGDTYGLVIIFPAIKLPGFKRV